MKKLFALLIMLFSFPTFAADEIYTGIFSNKAVSGYDTVAYFTQGKPVKGDSKWQTEYKGADWYFSSQENLDKFKADPDAYAPQYGGYCAWAISARMTLLHPIRSSGQSLMASFTLTMTQKSKVGGTTTARVTSLWLIKTGRH